MNTAMYSMENCTKSLSNEVLPSISTFLLCLGQARRQQPPRNMVLPSHSIICRKDSNDKNRPGNQRWRCFPALPLCAERQLHLHLDEVALLGRRSTPSSTAYVRQPTSIHLAVPQALSIGPLC